MSHILFGSVLLIVAGMLTAMRHHRHFGWRRLIGKLDATPAQERTLRELLLSARDQLSELHFDARSLRQEIGESVRGERFDEARYVDAEAKMNEKFRQASGVIRSTLEQAHEVLDSRQRAKVAKWLTAGPHCHRFSHC